MCSDRNEAPLSRRTETDRLGSLLFFATRGTGREEKTQPQQAQVTLLNNWIKGFSSRTASCKKKQRTKSVCLGTPREWSCVAPCRFAVSYDTWYI